MAGRIDSINEEVRRELSVAIRTVKDPRVNGLISITSVSVTPDMRYATVYISTFGDEEKNKDVLKGLKSAAGYLRRELGRKLQLRYIPELLFREDHSIKEGAHILDLLSQVKPPRENSDEPND